MAERDLGLAGGKVLSVTSGSESKCNFIRSNERAAEQRENEELQSTEKPLTAVPEA